MLPTNSNYQLLDFGLGRKLEQVGNVLLNRPCPGANNPRKGSAQWSQADLIYDLNEDGRWHYFNSWKNMPSDTVYEWTCEVDELKLLLKPTPAGQIGIFPEHWSHWGWLSDCVAQHASQHGNAPSALSLFAYTGATTLALARMGCPVTHVDASKPTVAWARRNQTASQLDQAAIRWIVDDAVGFVEREVRRGRLYDMILLDPPTYGHGAKNTRWEIHRHLLPLLISCWKLLSEHRCTVLLCGHSASIAIRDLNRQLNEAHGSNCFADCEVKQAYLTDESGRKLDCGFAAMYRFA